MSNSALDDYQQAILELQEEFNFHIEIEPADTKVLYLKFKDGRQYRLQHPGALVVARLFSSDSESPTADCLEYFITHCIKPIANTDTKVLNVETLDVDEALDFWLQFAWRYLRRSYRIVTA